MADQQENSSHQNQMEVDDAESNDLLGKKPITENRDALELVFKHLDIKSLMNVAHASKSFQEVAAFAFQQKYGSKTIVLCCFDNCLHKNHDDTNNRLCFRGLKSILPFVRVFGGAISKLEVHYYSRLNYANLQQRQRTAIDRTMERVNEYINTYCADTLSSLEWYHKQKLSNDFAKPFMQVVQLCIRWSYLNEQLLDYDDSFPNLQRLDMVADGIDQRFTQVLLPQLAHLVITFVDTDDNNANLAQLKNVGEFVKANPQLQSIVVNKSQAKTEYATAMDLFDMISGNPQLTKVEFSVSRNSSNAGTNVDEVLANRFVNEHPQLEELAIYEEHEFTAKIAWDIIQQLGALKKFRFNIKNEAERNQFVSQLGNGWIHTCKSERRYYSMNLLRKD